MKYHYQGKNDCDLVDVALDIQHGWCRPTNPQDFDMGPHVVNLLNLTPIFKWYMLRLVVKNLHQKNAFVMMRLEYVQKFIYHSRYIS